MLILCVSWAVDSPLLPVRCCNDFGSLATCPVNDNLNVYDTQAVPYLENAHARQNIPGYVCQ